jgi:hypothetical protein
LLCSFLIEQYCSDFFQQLFIEAANGKEVQADDATIP